MFKNFKPLYALPIIIGLALFAYAFSQGSFTNVLRFDSGTPEPTLVSLTGVVIDAQGRPVEGADLYVGIIDPGVQFEQQSGLNKLSLDPQTDCSKQFNGGNNYFWSQEYLTNTNKQGRYDLMLGSSESNPLALRLNGRYYIELWVKKGGDTWRLFDLNPAVEDAQKFNACAAEFQSVSGPGQGEITKVHIGEDEVGTSELEDNSVYSNNIKDGEVDTPDIKDLSVTSNKLADGAVKEKNIAPLAVTESKINTKAVYRDAIQAGAIVDDKVAEDAQISCTKIDASSCSWGGAEEEPANERWYYQKCVQASEGATIKPMFDSWDKDCAKGCKIEIYSNIAGGNLGAWGNLVTTPGSRNWVSNYLFPVYLIGNTYSEMVSKSESGNTFAGTVIRTQGQPVTPDCQLDWSGTDLSFTGESNCQIKICN